MKKTLLVALLAYVALMSSPAPAQQFFFTVPVNLQMLPERTTKFWLDCELYGGNPLRPLHDQAGGQQIPVEKIPHPSGTGMVGTYFGEVTIGKQVPLAWDPAVVTHYRCRVQSILVLSDDGVTDIHYFRDDPLSPRFPTAAPVFLDTGIRPLPPR
jgi:hypothetical protein